MFGKESDNGNENRKLTLAKTFAQGLPIKIVVVGLVGAVYFFGNIENSPPLPAIVFFVVFICLLDFLILKFGVITSVIIYAVGSILVLYLTGYYSVGNYP